MTKVQILKKSYPILINCFAGSHGGIFGEYWADPSCNGKMPEEIAYKSIEEVYQDLRKEIYPDNDPDYMMEVWQEIDNEVGDDPLEKIKRILMHCCSHGEVWGGVCSQLYHSTNEECWKLLADLLVLLNNESGEIGWDS